MVETGWGRAGTEVWRLPLRESWLVGRGDRDRAWPEIWRLPLRRFMLAFLAIWGCDAPKPAPLTELGSAPAVHSSFDAAHAHAISGRVTWNGPVPQAAPFEIMPNPLSGVVLQKRQQRPNPNLLTIEPLSHGIAGAIVFLRGVDPARAKPWDLPEVVVEQRDCQLRIVQGTTAAQVGFVRQGADIEMVLRDPWLHALHAGGSTFFTLTFPDPEQPLRCRLAAPGLVELSSNAGYFWMRGYLFVDDHPYYSRTDREGRFTLTGVPAGAYRLVAWLPNWHVARQERDPESGLVSRLFFEPPFELELPLELGTEDKTDLMLALPGHK